MVTSVVISKVLKVLERYLLESVGFRLRGYDYEIILLLPTDSSYQEKYSWVISSEQLNNIEQQIFIRDILLRLKAILPYHEYSSVSSINKLNSSDPIVQNIKFVLPFPGDMIETNIYIGNLDMNGGILIRSKILSKLKEGQAVTVYLKSGTSMNAGIISMDKDLRIKHYTGKGLKELFANDRSEEERMRATNALESGDPFLLDMHYIAFTNLDDIEAIR